MDQDPRKRVFEDVRRSVVRIFFKLDKNDMKGNIHDCGVMTIPGIIISIDKDGLALVLADSTFFAQRKKQKREFMVNFPKDGGGYEPEQKVPDDIILKNGFCMFHLKPILGDDYIQVVKFETRPLQRRDHVDAFVLPRESHAVPEGYCGGSIINADTNEISLPNCPLHEYGFLGTPLFNFRGHFVGMTYLDYMRVHALSVVSLCTLVLDDITGICYVSDGEESDGGPKAAGDQGKE